MLLRTLFVAPLPQLALKRENAYFPSLKTAVGLKEPARTTSSMFVQGQKDVTHRKVCMG